MRRNHYNNRPLIDYNYAPIPGDSRRGVIPKPETPKEKIERLRQKGYFVEPVVKKQAYEASSFENYDFGNRELPAYKHKQEMIDTVDNNRISMLVGPTGSGKTTQLGQFALEKGYRVVYLVPRRVIVDNVGERIQDELAEHLGEKEATNLVGRAHSEVNTIKDSSMIQVMTSGTFTKKLPDLAERWGDEQVLVVADEIHEGNLETEFASALAVRQVEKNDNWRVVFASATPDDSTIGETYRTVNGADVPVVEIEGRPHDLDIIEEPMKNIVEAYHENNAGVQKTIIFVEGKRAINETISELKNSMSNGEGERTRFYKLHANISERARRAIFDMELSPGEKAVIVSTSAGQSGITIPGVGLVVTSGLTKSPQLDDEGAPGLPPRFCTKAEIVQQAGRAGRDIEGGKCVVARPLGYNLRRNQGNELFAHVPIDEREPHIPPEIYNSNISRNILAATAMGEDFFELNDYLQHSVSQESIYESYDLLYNLGAVDDDNKITDLGATMDIFPLRPELSRAAAEIIHSKSMSIQAYTLAISSAIEAGGLVDFDERNNNWKQFVRPTTDDDFMLQMDLMFATRDYFYGNRVNESALADMGLNFKNAYRAHRQFDKMCKLIGLDPRDIDLNPPKSDEEQELRTIFLKGMPELIYKKVATDHHKGIYNNIWGFENAIRREVSSRSLLSSMGQKAVGLVAGYPRWYTDRAGEIHDVIDFGFVTSPEQIKEALGHLASKDLVSDVRNGHLVKTGKIALGSLPLGEVKAFRGRARKEDEIKKLVDEAMIHSPTAVEMLRDMGASEDYIREACESVAYGKESTYELDAALWDFVAEFQSQKFN